MADERVAGKRGLNPTTRHDTPLIREFLQVNVPTYPVDVTQGQTAWGMLGNGPDPLVTSQGPTFEGVGDCTFAGREHNKMAKALAGQEKETLETADALVIEYLAYDNGQDIGADIPTLLLAWYNAGKILAFGRIEHTDKAQCDWAAQTFHGLYCGVRLTPDANALFNQGQPWTVAGGQQPDPNEGHCIIKVKATATGNDAWLTWGQVQESTPEWTAACLTDTYVIVTEEDANAAVLDLRALLAAIDKMPEQQGGKPADTPPAPTPSPTPPGPAPAPPTPSPLPPLPLIQRFFRWVKRIFAQEFSY